MLYSELAREKMWARIHLMPVLQAEADREGLEDDLLGLVALGEEVAEGRLEVVVDARRRPHVVVQAVNFGSDIIRLLDAAGPTVKVVAHGRRETDAWARDSIPSCP